jgi:hypothetical protein
VSSQAFKPRKGEAGVSVDIEELRLAAGHLTSRRVPGLRNIVAVLRTTIDSCENVGLHVEHRPVRRDILKLVPPNPFHAELLGHASPKGLSKLRDNSEFAIALDQEQARMVHSRMNRFNIAK